MEKAKDILLDETGDLMIVDGDLVIGESDAQHIEHILKAAPGHYKDAPLVGANITSMLNGNMDGKYRQEVKRQLELDGFTVNKLILNQQDIIIDAERK